MTILHFAHASNKNTILRIKNIDFGLNQASLFWCMLFMHRYVWFVKRFLMFNLIWRKV